MLVAGTVAAVFGFSKLHASRIADPPYDFTSSFRFGWAIAYLVLLVVGAYAVGLPDLPRTRRSGIASAIAATFGAAAAISLVQLVAGDALLPRFVVFASVLVLVPWYLICVGLSDGSRDRSLHQDRVVVVGDLAEIAALRDEMDRFAEVPAEIVAVLSPDEAKVTGLHGRPLFDLVGAEEATVVVLDRAAQVEPSIVSQAAVLHESGTRLRTLSLFYEEWLGKLPVSELERVSLMFDIGEVHRARYGRVKRLIDVTLAAIGLMVLALAVPVVALANLVANRGPLFYRQPRVGKAGVEFEILKFRTMRAPTNGPAVTEWTTEDDPRITPFGSILRRSHLDELPQVVNILRGDLAVVGPRPEQPAYVEELTEKLPFYSLRHLVRPGLTGWAQVKYGYAGDERDALEKLQYEFFYLRRQGVGLDLRIVGRTLRSVTGRQGR
ncbi:MAG: sugar transferase [Acidimicrobiales bacterium]|nr:sugar transferase [Acidimicrobiales bacterium]